MGEGLRRVDASQVPSKFLSIVDEVVSSEMSNVEFYISGDIPMAVVVDRDVEDKPMSVKSLGCPLCIRPRISRNGDGRMMISGKMAVPLSAVSDEDPRNPLMQLLSFCPDCGSPVFDTRSSRAPLPGEISGFRDE